MHTEKVGVVVIHEGEDLVGIIYNDLKKRTKVLYKCEPMSEEDIIAVIDCEDKSRNINLIPIKILAKE